MFFKCFYDWDRERRMKHRMKCLNLRMFTRLLNRIIADKKRLGFEKMMDAARTQKYKIEEEVGSADVQEEEFDKEKALQMLMSLRNPGSSKVTKPKKIKIFVSPEKPSMLKKEPEITPMSKSNHIVQASIVKNNVRNSQSYLKPHQFLVHDDQTPTNYEKSKTPRIRRKL